MPKDSKMDDEGGKKRKFEKISSWIRMFQS